jgi:hypothetical protein
MKNVDVFHSAWAGLRLCLVAGVIQANHWVLAHKFLAWRSTTGTHTTHLDLAGDMWSGNSGNY